MDGLSEKELKTLSDMCSNTACEECALNDTPKVYCKACNKFMHKNIPEIKKACAEWEEERRHTYMDEFRNRFPENQLASIKIALNMCCHKIFHGDIDCPYVSAGCTKCWAKEYKPSTPTQD